MPLSHTAAALAYRLHHQGHRDPADRLLVATAIELACPSAPRDARILHFAEANGSHYGLTTSG